MRNQKILGFLIMVAASSLCQAANFHVTQAGAGAANGTSEANAWSVAGFNASTTPTGGDTVFFSGVISSIINPKTGGTGNSSRLTLDCSAATCGSFTLTTRAYMTIVGGVLSANAGFRFSGNSSHDITIQGWHQNNSPDSTSIFCDLFTAGSGYAITLADNMITNIANFVLGARTLTHDLVISNNAAIGSPNQTAQTDLIFLGDAYNVTITGNYILQQAPGATVGRHNDCIQCFRSGASPNGNPYGWVISYNWMELRVRGGSGDNSWLMLENMNNNGATDACKIYGNVFYGDTGTAGANGMSPNSNVSGARFLFYHNTMVCKGGPVNACRFQGVGTLYARNNIGYSPTDPSATMLQWEFTAGATWNYNWFVNWPTHPGSPNISTCVGPNGGTSNPLFVNYSNNDFSLSASSPCRGTGDNSLGSEYSTGIAFGATWPNPTLVARGGAIDPGAYQYSSAISANPIITIAPASLNFGSVLTNIEVDLSVTVRNTGGGTLSGMATVGAPFSVVSGAAFSLGAGQSQGVLIRYSPATAGTNLHSVIFSGGAGAACQVTGIAVDALAPIPSVTPTSRNFGSIAVGSTLDQAFLLQNTGGGTLSGNATVSGPFSIISGGAYSLAGGQTQMVTVRFSPAVAGSNSQNVVFSGGAAPTVAVSGVGVPVVSTGGLTLLPSDAILSAPFGLVNGSISQSVDTGVANGGQALYNFVITNAGTYAVQMLINAPGLSANSIFWNIDGQPQDPTMIWDIPLTTGIQLEIAGWRGNGTFDNNQLVPAKISLTPGPHQLVIVGREAGVQLQAVTILQLPPPLENLRLVQP